MARATSRDDCVNTTDNLARRGLWTATRLVLTTLAIAFGCTVSQDIVFRYPGSRLAEPATIAQQWLAGRADITVGLGFPGKVASCEAAILALCSLPHRRVRLDVPGLDDPVKHGCRATGGVTDQTFGYDAKALLDLSIMALVDSTSRERLAVVASTSTMIPWSVSTR